MEQNTNIWDRSAKYYDRFVALTSKDTHTVLNELLKKDIVHTERLLEAGTGTGSLAIALSCYADHIEACDISEEMLQIARTKANAAGITNIHFSQQDIYALNFPEEHFDVVVACNILHLLDNPQKALEALKRVAKKDGKIILPTFLLAENLRGLLFWSLARFFGVRVPNRWSRESYLTLLKECGLSIEKDIAVQGKVPLCYAVVRMIVSSYA